MGNIYYSSDNYRMGLGGGQMADLNSIWGGQMQQASSPLGYLNPNIPVSPLPPTPEKRKEKGMFGKVKEYIDEHKNIIFTLGLVILVDHFLFRGALKERIKNSIEGVLTKVEEKFHHHKEG
jgi:hypothetical protein